MTGSVQNGAMWETGSLFSCLSKQTGLSQNILIDPYVVWKGWRIITYEQCVILVQHWSNNTWICYCNIFGKK